MNKEENVIKVINSGNFKILLDEDDFIIYSQWKWQINNSGYARRTLKKNRISR